MRSIREVSLCSFSRDLLRQQPKSRGVSIPDSQIEALRAALASWKDSAAFQIELLRDWID